MHWPAATTMHRGWWSQQHDGLKLDLGQSHVSNEASQYLAAVHGL